MSTQAQSPGNLDLQRIRAAVDRIVELLPLVDRTMRAADGPDWMDVRYKRLRKRGARIPKDQRPDDPRVLLIIIAKEQALASVFSPSDRAIAARLRELANVAAHSNLSELRGDDATWAERSVDRLLQVGRAAMPPREAAGPDVHRWVRHAHAAERERDARRASASRAALERRADYFERAWWLNRTIATFRKLMAEAGDPGTEPIRRHMDSVLTHPFAGGRGWTLAYRGHGGVRLVLARDGTLWLCDATTGRRPRAEQTVKLDPRRPRTYVVGQNWTVATGMEELVGDLTTTEIPFSRGWSGTPYEHDSLSLEEAVAAGIGALCVTHGLEWPDDERAAAEQLAQELLVFLDDPPSLQPPPFPVLRALLKGGSGLASRLDDVPRWVYGTVAVVVIALAPELIVLLLLVGAVRMGRGVLRGERDPLAWLQRQPREPSYYLRGCLLLVVAWFVLALVVSVIDAMH